MSNTFWNSFLLDLQNSKLSSAKSKWVSFGPLLFKANPWIEPSFSAFKIRLLSHSIHSKNKKGDRGCLGEFPLKDGSILLVPHLLAPNMRLF